MDIGCKVTTADNGDITIDSTSIGKPVGEYDIVRKMRAGICILGPLLARCGKAQVSMPGGCAIGYRPVDIHIRGLRELGVQIDLENGYIVADATKGLRGSGDISGRAFRLDRSGHGKRDDGGDIGQRQDGNRIRRL